MGTGNYQDELYKHIRETGTVSWIRGDYSFNFGWQEAGIYRWNGKTFRISWGEALYLYQRLVLGRRDSATSNKGALSRMRARLGQNFLEEFLPKMTQRSRGKRAYKPRWDWYGDEDAKQDLVKYRQDSSEEK